MKKKSKTILRLCLLAVVLGVFLIGCFMLSRRKTDMEGSLGEAGVLRVLVSKADFDTERQGLHRLEMPIDRERALLKGFAEANGLELRYIPVPTFAKLFEELAAGNGDLISACVAKTEKREKDYLLSIPFAYTREILFASDRIPLKNTLEETLAGVVGVLLPGTSYVDNLKRFSKKFPFIRFATIWTTISHEDLIQHVVDGKIPYSVLNENDLDAWLAYNTGLRKLIPVQESVPLVFAARKDSPALIQKLNKFIQAAGLTAGRTERTVFTQSSPSKAVAAKTERAKTDAAKPERKKPPVGNMDLDSIRKRGYIRIITQNEYYCCFLDRGGLRGFEYELASKFARKHGLDLVVVIPPDYKSMTAYLEEGKGDFIAANYTRTDERIKLFPELNFCAPYCQVTEFLVGRENEKITKWEDLEGRKIFIRKSSSYYQTLKRYQPAGKYTIVLVPETEESLLILDKVSSGEYDLTASDEAILNLALNGKCKVKKIFPITEKRSYAWVTRKQDKQLAQAIDQFFRKENRSTFFNLLVKRYYGGRKKEQPVHVLLGSKKPVISPFDWIFKKYAALYRFDWYFLAAQSFHESRFDPDAVSASGAVGLMQVMPKTGLEMGVRNLKKPENGVRAGTKYMSVLIKRFSGEISPQDQLCFSLAAYNAGYGHVQDARKLAKSMGWNPNVWDGHTEKALALLERRKYASRSKYGFCRASETIAYVGNVMLYTNYYREFINAHLDKKKSAE